jgi:hypothetical protein
LDRACDFVFVWAHSQARKAFCLQQLLAYYKATMISNLERYKADVDLLLRKGVRLHDAMQAECLPAEFRRFVEKEHGKNAKKFIDELPSFGDSYQPWYSEAKALVRQLLPDRLADFVSLYEKPKPRKGLDYESYRIEDYLIGLRGGEVSPFVKAVGPDAAIPRFRQQIAILKSAKARFESSLFDIRQLVQADIFGSELDAAEELARNKFTRAAGALAGVVLERHLAQVSENHNIKMTKKAPGISDINDALKNETVIDVPQWRFIQHLGDIRNLCDHSKKSEPTTEQVDDLIVGVSKVTKTIF